MCNIYIRALLIAGMKTATDWSLLRPRGGTFHSKELIKSLNYQQQQQQQKEKK